MALEQRTQAVGDNGFKNFKIKAEGYELIVVEIRRMCIFWDRTVAFFHGKARVIWPDEDKSGAYRFSLK